MKSIKTVNLSQIHTLQALQKSIALAMLPIASYIENYYRRQVLIHNANQQLKILMDYPMQTQLKKTLFLLTAVSFLLVYACSPLYAASEKDMEGWGVNDDYNHLYDPKELDKLKGIVIKFKKIRPLPGMSKATALILDEGGDKIIVHICPVWFATAKDTGIKRGDKVKIKGSWAEINGEDVFMASKIKKGEHYQFKVRLTKDGTPFWTMSEKQLAYERNQE